MNNILNESHTQAIGAFMAASILMVCLSYKRWHQETKVMIDKIVHDEFVSGFNDNHEVYIHETLISLPLAIQQYLRKVLFLVDDYDNGKDYIMNKPLAIIKTRCALFERRFRPATARRSSSTRARARLARVSPFGTKAVCVFKTCEKASAA